MKKHKLIGIAVSILGVVLYAAGIHYGAAIMLIGLVWFIVGRSYD